MLAKFSSLPNFGFAPSLFLPGQEDWRIVTNRCTAEGL